MALNPQPTLQYLERGGEVGRSLLAHDWRGNPLGPPEAWPRQLHDTLRITLHSEFPHIVYWGEALHTFWNDAARHFFEGQHPHDLGRPLAEVQPDVMATLHPLLRQVFASGRAILRSDIELRYRRAGYTEEIHEVFSYSPLLDTGGRVRGVIAPVFDATARVLGARRMALLADLAASTHGARTLAQYHAALEACLRRHPRDLPLAALYAPEPEARLWKLRAGAGSWPASLHADGAPAWAAALRGPASRGPAQLQVLPAAAVLPGTTAFQQVALVPVPGQPPCWLVAALNPHKRLNGDYQDFLTLMVGQIGQGLASTLVIEQAADRALAEISSLTRLTTLGELATSIAHEINQPLTAMVLDANACARWLALQPADLAEARAAARRIADSGEYAGQVLARIRGFLQRAPSPHAPVDIAQVAWDSLRLVAAQARRHRIALRMRLPTGGLPAVRGDRTQLQQVLINLLVNAIDALQHQPDGAPRAIHLRIALAAARVRVEVADTGPGIAPGQLQRLFETFQTTKSHGLGFGLSIARSIVEAHEGCIQAESPPTGGALLWFELPALTAP